MEVTCERCETRYEFEDALVSEKGTTVKCSTCGHQFRVFRPSAGGVSRWVVRYADGTEQIFEAMRELQSAILSGDVSPEDVLVTEGKGERKLSTISELGDFFSRSHPTR